MTHLAIPPVIALAVLIGLAQDCPDSGSCSTCHQRALQAASQSGTQYSTAGCPNQRACSWPDTALIPVISAVPVAVFLVIVVAAMAAGAYSVIKLIAALSQCRQCSQHQKQ